MGQIDGLPVEPQMDGRDRRRRESFLGLRNQLRHESRRGPPRDGDDDTIAGHHTARDADTTDFASVALDAQGGHACLDPDAALPQPVEQSLTEENAQRLHGNMEIGGLRVGEKPIDGHLPCRRHADQIDRFAEGTFQDRLPEEPHDPLRLADPLEPRRRGVVERRAASAGEAEHSEAEPGTLPPGEVPHPEQERSEVERRRQVRPWGACRAIPLRRDEPQRPVVPQAPGKPRPTGEIEEVRAAPHGDMLTGVDEPATDGIIERGGASPDPPPRLEHRHPTAPLDERRGSR